jgi:hypothetical protein
MQANHNNYTAEIIKTNNGYAMKCRFGKTDADVIDTDGHKTVADVQRWFAGTVDYLCANGRMKFAMVETKLEM